MTPRTKKGISTTAEKAVRDRIIKSAGRRESIFRLDGGEDCPAFSFSCLSRLFFDGKIEAAAEMIAQKMRRTNRGPAIGGKCCNSSMIMPSDTTGDKTNMQ